MRRILTAGVLTLALAGVASAQFFDPPALEDRNGRMGFEFFMLEVPDPGSMVADADNSDWGWFDPEYTLTMDEWRDEADRPLPERDDYNITTLMGWKGSGLNKWYAYMEIVDDTLAHRGETLRLTDGDSHWNNDMIEFALDPQDHGRDFPTGWTMEYIARPGDFTDSNVHYRWVHEQPDNTPDTWLENDEIIEFAVRVEPEEAWFTDEWSTGGVTYYEWNYPVYSFMEDGGPSASELWDLDAVAGEDGVGLPFNLWAEDNDSSYQNDMTTRGPEASSRQYYAHSLLLRIGEYDSPTAVETSTWGQIKNSFK